MINHFMLSSAGILNEGRLHTLVTSAFSHSSLIHLGMNMAALLSFAPACILSLGTQRFTIMYAAATVLSSIAFVAYDVLLRPHLPAAARVGNGVHSLGASGAVASTVAFSILSQPNARVQVAFVLSLPAGRALLGLVLLDLANAVLGFMPVGSASHLSGEAVGAVAYAM